jgi:hypothetical protein
MSDTPALQNFDYTSVDLDVSGVHRHNTLFTHNESMDSRHNTVDESVKCACLVLVGGRRSLRLRFVILQYRCIGRRTG